MRSFPFHNLRVIKIPSVQQFSILHYWGDTPYLLTTLGHETRCHQEPQRGTGTLHHGQTEAWCDAPDRVPGVEQLKSGTKSRNCQDLVGTGLFVWEVFSNFWVVLERTTYLDGSFLGPAENLVFR